MSLENLQIHYNDRFTLFVSDVGRLPKTHESRLNMRSLLEKELPKYSMASKSINSLCW
jgi:hypothetical protein